MILHLIRRVCSNSDQSRFRKFTLTSICCIAIYIFLVNKFSPNHIQASSAKPLSRAVQKHPHAFIITAECISARFNATKENIQRVFPNFFTIHCYKNIPLNDSRIHPSPVLHIKKFSSNQLAFVDLWTAVIPKYSAKDDLQWSFIFEDDINFVSPARVSLLDYTSALQEMMANPEIQLKDGFMYLGICGPDFDKNETYRLVPSQTNKTLLSQRGYGFCLHASGITARRSLHFWGEIASYRPNAPDNSLDLQLRQYSMRSGKHYYTFGSNFLFPPGTDHFGIAYQDRGRFSTTVA